MVNIRTFFTYKLMMVCVEQCIKIQITARTTEEEVRIVPENFGFSCEYGLINSSKEKFIFSLRHEHGVTGVLEVLARNEDNEKGQTKRDDIDSYLC